MNVALAKTDTGSALEVAFAAARERLPVTGKVAELRQLALETFERTGLPHRIVVDEAHYFLHDEDASTLIDLELSGYTVVTYRASKLPPALLAACEVMLVTCESNPEEIAALHEYCARCDGRDPAAWSLLSRLKVGQAAALPVTEEAAGQLRMLTLGPRMTPHVRHREKYVDVPVSEARAFAFAVPGRPRRARTLRQFVTTLALGPPSAFEVYVQRGDFSRWVRDVFGDRALADQLQAIEARHRVAAGPDTIGEIVEAIRARYDLVDDLAAPDAVVA